MTTRFLAKLMGLWLLLTVGSMIATRDSTIGTMNALFGDPALTWIAGVFTLLLGLVVVLCHNRWSGGAGTVVVTLYGWIATLKGLLFLCLPAPVQAQLWSQLHFAQYFYAYLVFALAIGSYLLYAGFTVTD